MLLSCPVSQQNLTLPEDGSNVCSGLRPLYLDRWRACVLPAAGGTARRTHQKVTRWRPGAASVPISARVNLTGRVYRSEVARVEPSQCAVPPLLQQGTAAAAALEALSSGVARGGRPRKCGSHLAEPGLNQAGPFSARLPSTSCFHPLDGVDNKVVVHLRRFKLDSLEHGFTVSLH